MPWPVMAESPSCYLVWVFLILTILLFVGGCVGCWHAAEETHRKRQGGDVEMQWNPRECRMEPAARPPPPPKRWSPEERRALARVVSRLPPPCIREVRAIVGSDEPTVDFASLDVSVCDRLQQYVDAQPLRDSLAAKADQICGLSGIALVCVVPAFCGFWYFAIRCAFSGYG